MSEYFSFTGRDTRARYWAVQIMAIVLLIVVVALIATAFVDSDPSTGKAAFMLVAMIGYFWALFASAARRCIDAGISRWWLLTLLIPNVAIVPWIIFGILPTDKMQDFH